MCWQRYLSDMPQNTLRDRLKELGLSQKEAAVRILDQLERAPVDERFELITITTKLSKLLANDPEGVRFFSHPVRLSALAAAVDLAPGVVSTAINPLVLLFDPRFPKVVFDALVRQATAASVDTSEWTYRPNGDAAKAPQLAMNELVEAWGGGEPTRVYLRDASDEQPLVIVVLVSDEDREWFSKKNRRVTRVRRVPRGYALEIDRELIPPPEPIPPPRWMGDTPMLSCAELTETIRAEVSAKRITTATVGREGNPLHARLLAADERGEEPAFPLEDCLAWLRSKAPQLDIPPADSWRQEERIFGRPPQLTLPEIVGAPEKLYVWWHKHQLFAAGPGARDFAALLAPDHEVHVDIEEINTLRRALETTNPFGAMLDARVAAVKERVGVSVEPAIATWRAELSRWEGAPVRLATGEDEAVAQSELLAIAQRPIGIAERKTGDDRISTISTITVPLQLLAAAEAPLLLLPKGRFDTLHVFANLGAGRMLRIRIAKWKEPAPTAFAMTANEWLTHIELDGGEHVWIDAFYEEMLEGVMLRPRARRAAEAARSDDD